jgi:hypothetical protein
MVPPAFLGDEETLTWGIVVTYDLARHAVTKNQPSSLSGPLTAFEPNIIAALEALPEPPE